MSAPLPEAATIQTRQQFRNSAALLFGQAMGRAGSLAVQVLIARLFGGEAFGLYALGLTLVLLSQTLGHLGLSDGLLRYLPKYRGAQDGRVKGILLEGLGFSGMVGTGIAIGAVAFAAPIAGHIFEKPAFTPVLIAFAPALLLAPVLQVAAAATRAAMAMHLSVLTLDLGIAYGSLAMCAVLWALGYSVTGMAAGTSATYMVVTAVCLFFVTRTYGPELRSGAPMIAHPLELLRFSLPTISVGALAVLMSSTDRLFIGVYGSLVDLGAYHAATQLTMPIAMIYYSLVWAVAPRAAAASWQNRSQDLELAYQNMCRWGLYLAFPIIALLFVFSGEILTLLYGPEFAGAESPMRILIVGQLVYLLGGVPGIILVMTGLERLWFAYSACAVAANAGLNALLVPAYGMFGAAAATALTTAALHAGGILTLRRRYGIWPLTRQTLVAALAGSLALVSAIVFARVLIDASSTSSKLTGIGIGLCIFTAMIMCNAKKADAWLLTSLRSLWRGEKRSKLR